MDKTFFVQTDQEGLGTRENPYRKPNPYFETGFTEVDEGNLEAFNANTIDYINLVAEFEAQYPDGLPTYSQNNVLIVNSRVEVYAEPEWQYLNSKTGIWKPISDVGYKDIYGFKNENLNDTRRIYRQVAIKEDNGDEHIDGFIKWSEENPNHKHVNVSSAQPVKEVSAQDYLDKKDLHWTYQANGNGRVLHDVDCKFCRSLPRPIRQ